MVGAASRSLMSPKTAVAVRCVGAGSERRCATQTLFNKAGCELSADENVSGFATLVEGVIVRTTGRYRQLLPVQIYDAVAGHPMQPRWNNECRTPDSSVTTTTSKSTSAGGALMAPARVIFLSAR